MITHNEYECSTGNHHVGSLSLGYNSAGEEKYIAFYFIFSLIAGVRKHQQCLAVVDEWSSVVVRSGVDKRSMARDRSEGDDRLAANTGDDTASGLTGSHLGQRVGLRLGLSLSIVSSVGMVGRVDSRNMMDQRSQSTSIVTVVDGSDDTASSLASSHLGQSVGIRLSLSLAVVDMGKGSSRYMVGQRNSSDMSHPSLGSVGDDTNVVKTTFSDSIPYGLSSSNLGYGPGLGIPSDGHHHQTQLQDKVLEFDF